MVKDAPKEMLLILERIATVIEPASDSNQSTILDGFSEIADILASDRSSKSDELAALCLFGAHTFGWMLGSQKQIDNLTQQVATLKAKVIAITGEKI